MVSVLVSFNSVTKNCNPSQENPSSPSFVKNSTLITSSVIEAYLINTNNVSKDVKTAFTLSKVIDNGNTYYTFSNTSVAASTQLEMEMPTAPAVEEVEVQEEL